MIERLASSARTCGAMTRILTCCLMREQYLDVDSAPYQDAGYCLDASHALPAGSTFSFESLGKICVSDTYAQREE